MVVRAPAEQQWWCDGVRNSARPQRRATPTHSRRGDPKSSYYAASSEDRTIDPNLERFMAKRMGDKTIEVRAISR